MHRMSHDVLEPPADRVRGVPELPDMPEFVNEGPGFRGCDAKIRAPDLLGVMRDIGVSDAVVFTAPVRIVCSSPPRRLGPVACPPPPAAGTDLGWHWPAKRSGAALVRFPGLEVPGPTPQRTDDHLANTKSKVAPSILRLSASL